MPIYKSTLNTNNKKPKKNKEPKEKIKMSKEKKKKITLVSLLILSIIFFALLLFNNPIQNFLLGLFGIFAYPFFLSCSLLLIAGVSKKKYFVNKRYIVCLSLSLFFIITIIHLILTRNINLSTYSQYLKQTYKTQTTGGGLIFSLFTFPMANYLTKVGAYVLTVIGLIISVGFTADCIIVARNKPEKKETNFDFADFKTLNENTNDVKITFESKQEDIKRKIAKQKLGLEKNESSIISSSMHIDNITDKLPKSRPMSKQEYILTPPEIVIPEAPKKKENIQPNNINNTNSNTNNFNSPKTNTEDVIVSDAEDFYDDAVVFESKREIETPKLEENKNINKTINETVDFNIEEKIADIPSFEITEELEEVITDNPIKVEEVENHEYSTPTNTATIPFANPVETKEIRPLAIFDNPNNQLHKTIVEEKKPERVKKNYPPYVKPPVDLLNHIENVEVVTDEECNENIEKLERVLEDFKIPAKVKAVQVGPAVTRYEIGMPQGISVKKVQMHADDIAMVLASNGSIRIEAPIPGKNAVGIEVPNKNVTAVSLREMVESLDFQKRVHPMSFVLGKDINGAIQFCNLDKMPHLLVAGSTGSGKSVCLNTMLISMLYKSSPEDVRFILIDPKTVEFSVYANLPHLLTPHIITTKEQAINALNWAIKEMEYRYTLLQQNEVVNIKEYNNLPIVKDGIVNKLPYIVIVIDELNDLMIDTKREMEERIMKLAQKSRAAGIHLVIATQRPSVDVITGTIKANLPSRIAFALTNFADSKTVLDMGGAEKLLGRGDSLFKPNDMPEPRRIQGAYISSAEVSAVVKFIKANNAADFDEDTTNEITAVEENIPQSNNNNGGNSNNGGFDPVLKDALRWFISANQASITMIQRRFGVGYARAARIVDQMEQNGFISAQDGSKPRQVLITMDDFNKIFPV